MFFNCSPVFMITTINATDVVLFARLRIIIMFDWWICARLVHPSRIHLFDVWLMVLRKSDTIESSRIHLFDVWLMILYRRCIWLTTWPYPFDWWGECWRVFVRRLRDVISNESILVLKENKRNFYSFQHIFIQFYSAQFKVSQKCPFSRKKLPSHPISWTRTHVSTE